MGRGAPKMVLDKISGLGAEIVEKSTNLQPSYWSTSQPVARHFNSGSQVVSDMKIQAL